MVMNVWEQIIIRLSIKVIPMFAIIVPVVYSNSTYNMLS